MEDQIRKAALEWAKSIESRIPEKVFEHYHTDGALWGTLAQEYRHGHKEIIEYFISFLNKEDLKCIFTNGLVRIYHDFAFYSGSYLFTWSFAGKKVNLPARFSFVYKLESGNWLIMEHHSSMFPDKPFRIRKFMSK